MTTWTKAASWSLATIVLLLLSLTAAVTGSRTAEAQATCTAGTANTTVTSATELDNAIDCYNLQQPAGDHVITFGVSFAHLSGTPSITQANAALSLTIRGLAGQNHTLTGPGPDDFFTFDLFVVDTPGGVNFERLTITNAERDAIFIEEGTVSVNNTTLIQNGRAGLVMSDGSVIVTNSTVTGNQVGLSTLGGTLMVSNSTIESNTDLGLIAFGGALTASNSTVAFNRGGILSSGGAPASLQSVVLSNSLANCQGPLVNLGNNYSSDSSCRAFVPLSANSLSPLGANGGATRTIELRPTSNALGGGACGTLTTDQRAFARTVGAKCDAGAFEAALLDVFVDVAPTGFYADAATWAAANVITTGTGNGTTFSPNNVVTRAQMATFLWRFAGEPEPAGDNPFSDIPDGRFFTLPVTWLAETGITTGTGDGTTFSPNAALNRAQALTLLHRFAQQPA